MNDRKIKNKIKDKKRTKGFSLVEIIIVIAIIAVIAAFLAPALLNYVEDAKMQKDESAMTEVVNAIRIGLINEDTFAEVSRYSCYHNRSCYIDKTAQKDVTSFRKILKEKTKDGHPKYDEQYTFNNEAKIDDEISYNPAGEMRGITITFLPEKIQSGKIGYKVKEARINNMSGAAVQNGTLVKEHAYELKTLLSTMHKKNDKDNHYLYNDVIRTIGNEIELSSKTYRNSEFTVFIRFDSKKNNSVIDRLEITGEFNGTNLPEPEKILTPEPPDPAEEEKTPVTPPTPTPNPGGGGGVSPDFSDPQSPTEPEIPKYKIIVNNANEEAEIVFEGIEQGETVSFMQPEYFGHVFQQYNVIEGTGDLQQNEIDKKQFTFTCQGTDAKIEAAWTTIKSGTEINDPDSDYIYRFNQNYNFSYAYGGAWEDAPNQNGWGVLVKPERRGKTQFQEIEKEIGGYPIKSLHSTFHKCFNMVESPEIPETVTDVKLTYLECYGLLKAPHIPEGVTRMDETFEYCSYMVTPSNIPANVQSAKYTYYCCYSLNGTVTIDTNHINKFGDGNPSETNSAFAAFYKVDMSKVKVVGQASNQIKNWFGCLGYNWEYLPE